MRLTYHHVAIVCALITGCIEGPSGPPGRDGQNAIQKDSIILNRFDFFIHFMKKDTSVIFSQSAQTIYNNIDTSIINDDSVYDGNNLTSVTFVRTNYTPTNWEIIRETTGFHQNSNDSTNWIVANTSSLVYWSASITPLNRIDRWGASFYPGHGFIFNWEWANAEEGRLKIYYWR